MNRLRAYHDWECGHGWDYYIGPEDNGSLDLAIATGMSEIDAKAFVERWNESAAGKGEIVAWMHPEAGWVHADREMVAPHCHINGPYPIPLCVYPAKPEPPAEGS